MFPVQQIRLRFADNAPPLPFFTLSLSKGERVELDFAATVFQNNTRFRAFLERESGLDTLRQQVNPGDAVPDLAGAGDAVSLPVDGSLYLFRLQIAGDSATRTLVRSIGLSY